MKSPKSGRKSGRKVDDRLHNEFKDKQQKLIDMQNLKMEEENKLMKKKPTISPKSKQIANQLGRTFMQN